MPPKGAPLSKSQIQSIGDWILDGASFGDWMGATDGVVLEKAKDQYVPKHVVYFKSLENGLEPLPESLSTQLSKVSSASIRRLHPESPLLDVGFFTTPNEIGDQQLAQLMGLREHVTKLSLARTGVTDKSVSRRGNFLICPTLTSVKPPSPTLVSATCLISLTWFPSIFMARISRTWV